MEDAALGIIPFLPIQNALGLILASIFQIRNVQNIMQKMYHPCVGWWKLTKITWNDKKRGYPPKMRSDFFLIIKKNLCNMEVCVAKFPPKITIVSCFILFLIL